MRGGGIVTWDDLGGWDAVTVRPLTTWPGGKLGYRRSPFSAPWHQTLRLLDQELRALEAKNVVLELALTERDIRIDGKPRARAVASHPGIVVSMATKYGPLRYACGEFETWQANIRGFALSLEALRKVDRYGVSRGEQYAGWKQIEATTGNGTGDLDRGRVLISKYGSVRDALRATHPDLGGKPADFRAVIVARDTDFGGAS